MHARTYRSRPHGHWSQSIEQASLRSYYTVSQQEEKKKKLQWLDTAEKLLGDNSVRSIMLRMHTLYNQNFLGLIITIYIGISRTATATNELLTCDY